MKKIAVCVVFCLSAGLFAAEPVDSAKLADFLPGGDIEGFTRMNIGPMEPANEITGATANFMKMPVVYNRNSKVIMLSIFILDGARHPESIDKEIAPNSKDDEAITIKGKYKGIRHSGTSASLSGQGDRLCTVKWLVGGRFVVQVFTSGAEDFSLAESLIDLIDLKGLEAASQKK
jgi:hypothetical protein